MSIILETSDGASLRVNAWNWGVLHHVVANAGVLPDELWAPKRYNGGGDLDASQVTVLADFLANRIFPRIRAGERMFFDGTVTAAPDDGTFYREEADMWRNYSLQREVLEKVIEFLRSAGGAVSFH